MSKRIPQDVEDFLYTLGTSEQIHPAAFEEYARTAATLLWEKHVSFENASTDIEPEHSSSLCRLVKTTPELISTTSAIPTVWVTNFIMLR